MSGAAPAGAGPPGDDAADAAGAAPPMRIPQLPQKSMLVLSCPAGQVGMAAPLTPWSGYLWSGYFLVLTVLVDLVSSAISSASSTFFFSRTVPDAASTTSTTLASSLAVPSLPDCSASA